MENKKDIIYPDMPDKELARAEYLNRHLPTDPPRTIDGGDISLDVIRKRLEANFEKQFNAMYGE